MHADFFHTHLIKVKELAELLRISDSTVYRLKENGDIPFLKIGGSLRFQLSDISEYLQKCKKDLVQERKNIWQQ